MVRRLKVAGRDISSDARVSHRKRADEILADSILNYVPFRDGVLANSGSVSSLGSNQFQSLHTISFDAVHAVPVHETPSRHDPPSWRAAGVVNFTTGGPKYLEKPFRLAAATMAGDIAFEIRF